MDMRGFGKSSWSPSKDYSTDAKLDDIRAIMDARGWRKIALMVHSMTGRIGVMFAVTYPDLIEKLVVIDSALGSGGGAGGGEAKLNQAPQLFQSVEEAMKSLAGRANPPRFSRDRGRAEQALRKVEGGYMLTRDPDFGNVTPQWPGIRMPKLNGGDIWDGLKNTKCPVRYVSGLRSDRRKADALTRLVTQKNVTVSDVDSEHDVAGQASDALAVIVKEFLAG
jgi:pimeloyl-ACP methyl ester carboxylesterase